MCEKEKIKRQKKKDPIDAESLIALGLLKIQCLLLSFSSVQLKRITDSAASHEWLVCTLT